MATDWPKEEFAESAESTEPPKRRSRPDTPEVRCPQCKADPLILWNSNMTDDQGRVLLIISCVDCRDVIGISQIAQIDTRGGRIIKPS